MTDAPKKKRGTIDVPGIGDISLQEWHETSRRADEIVRELIRLYPYLDEYEEEYGAVSLVVAFTLRLEAKKAVPE